MNFLRSGKLVGEAKIAPSARAKIARYARLEAPPFVRLTASRFARLRATGLLLSRFTRMNVLAYVAIVRVVITERLWRVPARVQAAATSGRGAAAGAQS
jgi:hypothetical protein